jgi:peptidoglycan/xylan/chitin deacetylase (PgdA/CDA1 family)
MSTVIARRAALLASFLLASPLRALAAEPDRRLPPVDVSAIQAAEMEGRPLCPPPKTFEIPILIYHHVIPGGGSPVLHVSPGGFEQQLQYLQSNGYQSVSSADLANCLEYGAPLPERPVILSFDDGWENQYQYAFPLLQKYGFTGTFYVVSGYLDHQNFMTTAQLKTMMAAGMVIGGHSRTHPTLAGLGSTRLHDEVASSKAWLEDRLGVAIDSFAYPYGSYSAATVAAVKAAGYRTARTVDTGTQARADSLALLPAVLYSEYVNHYRGNVELASRPAPAVVGSRVPTVGKDGRG